MSRVTTALPPYGQWVQGQISLSIAFQAIPLTCQYWSPSHLDLGLYLPLVSGSILGTSNCTPELFTKLSQVMAHLHNLT